MLRALKAASGQPPAALAPLFACDQLTATKRSCELHPLQQFQEATAEDFMPFPPTYKFLEDSEEYDPRRTPSWTDRILWRSNYHLDAQDPIAAIQYACVPCMQQSDHRPVVATVVVQLKHSSKVTLDQAAGLEDADAAARERNAGRRALKKWLGEATSRLRALRGPAAALVAVTADGDYAPFRHNAEMLKLGGAPDEAGVRGSRSLPRTPRGAFTGGA